MVHHKGYLVLFTLALLVLPTVAVAAAPNVTVTLQGAPTRATSPGTLVTLTFIVQNAGSVSEDLTFDESGPAGWGAAVDVAAATLAAGESKWVNVTVTPTTSPLSAPVFLHVAAAGGWSTARFARVDLPVTLSGLHFNDATTSTAVTGVVTAKWLDGSNAAGATVAFVESAVVSQVSLLTLPQPVPYGGSRTTTSTVAANGVASISFPISVTGANSPRDHQVSVYAVGAPAAPRPTDLYFVS